LPAPTDIDLDAHSTKHSIATVLAELAPDDLERMAIDVIREHRRRLADAQDLHDSLNAQGDDEEDRLYSYRLALVMVKLHHQLVAMIIDKLGYVPAVPDDQTMQ